MNYTIITPQPPLDDYIERIWYIDNGPQYRRDHIVPTGSIELVFNLNEDALGFYDVRWPDRCNQFSGAVFSGVFGQPLIVESRKNMIGAHFKPGGAFAFLGIPASEITDSHLNLGTLWGQYARDLQEKLHAAMTMTERLNILQSSLIIRLQNAPKEHRAVQEALCIFSRESGKVSINALTTYLGLSQRYFIKVFSEQVGITPKLFGRLQRFQHALELTRNDLAPNWAEIATVCGYFDQSHLIHDFQIFAGQGPSNFHKQREVRDIIQPSSNNLVKFFQYKMAMPP